MFNFFKSYRASFRIVKRKGYFDNRYYFRVQARLYTGGLFPSWSHGSGFETYEEAQTYLKELVQQEKERIEKLNAAPFPAEYYDEEGNQI